MADAPVVFDHVWKKFRRGQRHDSLRDLIPATARRLLRGGKKPDFDADHDFWVLKDVSFEVAPGEALGIIGPNGAGKSTTLKLLTRILRPNKGSCHIRGRVGALIEVAAGFHPDLTGRENIFLQGSIMGMKRHEIRTHLDEIIAFAGVEDFIDTQVKRYSTGMNARLGFSIAAHLNPDVLIIDEVLSVGDMQFQQRCVARMQQFKRSGVTIVFVSHDLHAVARLCDRALLLKRAVGLLDKTSKVIEEYVRSATENQSVSSTGINIVSARLAEAGPDGPLDIEPGARIRLKATYEIASDLTGVQFGFLMHRASDGLLVYDESFPQEALGLPVLRAGDVVSIEFEFTANVNRGQYQLELHVLQTGSFEFLARLRPAAVFSVSETRSFAGVVHLAVRPTAESVVVVPRHGGVTSR